MKKEEYSGYDALRMALEMERKGSSFYRRLSEKVSHRSLKDIFKQLGREEEEHIKTVEEKLLPICQSDGAYWADEELMVAHLKRMMAGGVFPNEERVLERLEETGSEMEALHIAIQAERESIDLYKKAGEAAANEEGKKAFTSLVEEEERHLQLLHHWQKELAEHGGA